MAVYLSVMPLLLKVGTYSNEFTLFYLFFSKVKSEKQKKSVKKLGNM